jgi:myo-inositol-1(or 4)-monophosphatase
MQNDLLACRAAAIDAARRAAAVIDDWKRRFVVREKGRCDFVTDADVASQNALRESLLGRFPDHAFLGEEDASKHVRPGPDSPPTWIVDPIDGTTNYVHDCPFYCVSIGLQIAGELVVGVVFDPSRDEMFAAAQGHGAFLNDRRLETSRADRIDQALMATGFAPDLRGQEIAFDWWRHFSLTARSMRRTGSTALNMAYVAAGRFDAYYAFDNHVWDVAGGTVLVREAGGTVTNLDGSRYDPFTPDAIASNGPLQQPLVAEFARGASSRPKS